MLSTWLIGLKLLATFFFTARSKPGYVEKEKDQQFDFKTLMKIIPAKKLCFECEVIKGPGTEHCHVCKRCVTKFEKHSVWLNTCVGSGNHLKYFLFIFYVWLDVFLIGWISMASIGVPHCEIDHCIYASLCIACEVPMVHYFTTVVDMVICFGIMIPTTWMCCCQCINFGKGKTTNERFAKSKNNATASMASESDATSKNGQEAQEAQEPGCFGNCTRMCCTKRG